MTVITGRGISVISAFYVMQGLKMHRESKGRMQLTRIATPKLLMQRAAEITGKTFRPRDYAGAERALRQWIEAEKLMAVAEGAIK